LADTLAFVTPWYGRDIPGGAESECRATAHALAARGVRVEILTTCAREHGAEWTDHHPPGLTEEDGLPVRRFKVRPRDRDRYARLDWWLHHGYALAPDEEAAFVRESIHSDDLYAYLRAERDRYWYLFIPYCFGTTWEGALVAPERSLLIPCLHDEPYAALRRTREVLAAVRAVCFHVPAERALAERLTGGPREGFVVVGEGLDTTAAGDGARFRERYGVRGPFLLAVGRQCPEKNTPLLIEYFTRYRLTHRDRPLQLVLIGPGAVRVPNRVRPDVVELGYVPVQDKYDAYAAALALCQPSLLESFSLVLMEAWLCGTPVLVHGGCAVTREHCLASNGGLYFEEYFEFAEAVSLLAEDAALRARLAANGRAYVLARYTWERVTASYLEVFERVGARVR
jgi:glycosyltransferase involved in cell wall biosynthesis